MFPKMGERLSHFKAEECVGQQVVAVKNIKLTFWPRELFLVSFERRMICQTNTAYRYHTFAIVTVLKNYENGSHMCNSGPLSMNSLDSKCATTVLSELMS